jgi:hypothetical protein
VAINLTPRLARNFGNSFAGVCLCMEAFSPYRRFCLG